MWQFSFEEKDLFEFLIVNFQNLEMKQLFLYDSISFLKFLVLSKLYILIKLITSFSSIVLLKSDTYLFFSFNYLLRAYFSSSFLFNYEAIVFSLFFLSSSRPTFLDYSLLRDCSISSFSVSFSLSFYISDSEVSF